MSIWEDEWEDYEMDKYDFEAWLAFSNSVTFIPNFLDILFNLVTSQIFTN